MKSKWKFIVYGFLGAFFQGWAMDISIPFFKGAFIVTGTLFLIHSALHAEEAFKRK